MNKLHILAMAIVATAIIAVCTAGILREVALIADNVYRAEVHESHRTNRREIEERELTARTVAVERERTVQQAIDTLGDVKIAQMIASQEPPNQEDGPGFWSVLGWMLAGIVLCLAGLWTFTRYA